MRRRAQRAGAKPIGNEATLMPNGRPPEPLSRAALAVLRGLITALYRHVCTHIVEAWEIAVAVDGSSRPWWRRGGRPLAELDQLRGHLDLQFDQAPNVVTLRKIWRRAGFLRRGVLPNLY